MSSLFTKIIQREIPAHIIYEDTDHIAILDIHPLEKGHTLVIPKKEYATIFDMPEAEYLALQKVVLKIAKHYESILGCGINILQNNKEVSGQSVFHVHVHVIPRQVSKEFLNFQVWEKYSEEEMSTYQKKLQLN